MNEKETLIGITPEEAALLVAKTIAQGIRLDERRKIALFEKMTNFIVPRLTKGAKEETGQISGGK